MPDITLLEPVTRLVLRGRPGTIEAASFGVPLSPEPSRSVTVGDRSTLHLGPDEWWLFAPDGDRDAIVAGLAASLANTPHSLVDVSHRQVGLHVAGRNAATVLAAFCPLDLDLKMFPNRACTRTVFSKADVMVWRRGADAFHVEVARSFLAYVSYLLRREAAWQAMV